MSTPLHASPTLYIRPVDLPGLYDAQLVNVVGRVVSEYRDLTSGQVNQLALQHRAQIEQVPTDA